MRQKIFRRVVDPLLSLLRQGLSPERLALSVAVGIALGVLPVLGTTTLLCTLAAILFRLNVPAMQLVNYSRFLPATRAPHTVYPAGGVALRCGPRAPTLRADPESASP